MNKKPTKTTNPTKINVITINAPYSFVYVFSGNPFNFS